MTREEFIKQRCEIDKITEEEFEKRYRVVKCNCGQPYCKGYRCLDLDGLLKENQELKKQLEEKNKPQIFIETQDMEERYAEGLYQDYLEEENKKYKNQQKEFILYLRHLSNWYSADGVKQGMVNEILQKYKEIIGDDK